MAKVGRPPRPDARRLNLFLHESCIAELVRMRDLYGLTLSRLMEIAISTLVKYEDEVFEPIKRPISPQAQTPSPPTS